jgi:hypothetical protein
MATSPPTLSLFLRACLLAASFASTLSPTALGAIFARRYHDHPCCGWHTTRRKGEPMEVLAASVVALLSPYVAAGAKKAAEVLGTALANQTTDLLARVRGWFAGDQEAKSVLDDFEKKPSRYGGVLEDILSEKAKSDPDRAKELESMIDRMGPRVEVIQKMRVLAGEAVGLDADKWEQGVARVEQTVDEVKAGGKLTGARVRNS